MVEHKENSEFLDLTDKENLEFRVSCLGLADHRKLLTGFGSTEHNID